MGHISVRYCSDFDCLVASIASIVLIALITVTASLAKIGKKTKGSPQIVISDFNPCLRHLQQSLDRMGVVILLVSGHTEYPDSRARALLKSIAPRILRWGQFSRISNHTARPKRPFSLPCIFYLYLVPREDVLDG